MPPGSKKSFPPGHTSHRSTVVLNDDSNRRNEARIINRAVRDYRAERVEYLILAAVKSCAAAFGHCATQAPQPMQVAASKAASATSFCTGIRLASGALSDRDIASRPMRSGGAVDDEVLTGSGESYEVGTVHHHAAGAAYSRQSCSKATAALPSSRSFRRRAFV